MKKSSVFIIMFVVSLFIYSCTKDDGPKTIPAEDFDVQYEKDSDSIEKFLDTHYMTVDANYNVSFNKIPTGGTQPSIRQQTTYPLQSEIIENEQHKVDYKLYYINLRQGIEDSPSPVDSVHVSYKGNLMKDLFQFDYAENPIWLTLDNVIAAWPEIFPKFKTGTFTDTSGPNPVVFENFGAGVMFVPSGLGYFNQSSPSGTIPAYSNLVFSFKLFEVQYRDHDRDEILSKDEVPDGSPISYNPIDYDSDGDGIANMFDVDDDGDRVTTIKEISIYDPINSNEVIGYYPFNSIPSCSGSTTKRHLDSTCKPPY